MEIKLLSQLGLNDSEIKVYLALLDMESSTVGPIIKNAGVPDSKIYIILEKLKTKGLVSFVIKNNVRHYQASDPKNLIRLLDEREKEIEEQKERIRKELIPQIEERRKITEDKQEALVYEGLGGMKAAFGYVLSTMNKGEEYSVFVLGKEYERKESIHFFNNYHKKRIEKGVKVKFISEEYGAKIIKKYYNYTLMQHRVSKQKIPIGTLIFKGHVMIVSWQDKPTAFIIKSEKAYEYYKAFFEHVWNSCN